MSERLRNDIGHMSRVLDLVLSLSLSNEFIDEPIDAFELLIVGLGTCPDFSNVCMTACQSGKAAENVEKVRQIALDLVQNHDTFVSTFFCGVAC